MIIKKIYRGAVLCLVFAAGLQLPAFAQGCRIVGTVSDLGTKEKIPFATVSLFADGKMQAGTASGNDGNFSLNGLQPGKYSVVVSFMGYHPDTIRNVQVTKTSQRVNLGLVALKSVTFDVGEVQVSANARTTASRIDRQTYRASDFETAKGGTAAELLGKLPSVSIDPEGNVSVRGTTDFVVYLNGKPTQLDPSVLLGQIPGSQVENVEVITVPGARYDSQGKGGIINITTRKNAAGGLSVSVNGLAGGAPWSNTTDRYSGFRLNDDRYGGGANFVYQNKKLTLAGGINFNHRNVNGRRVGDARILAGDQVFRFMVADGERPEWYEYLAASLGADYRISDKSVLSGSFYYGNRTEGRSAFYVYDIFYADRNKITQPGTNRRESWIYNPNTDTRYGTFQNWSLDYSHAFSKSSDLKVSLLYERSGLKRELQNQNFQYDRTTGQPGAIALEYRQTDDTPLDGYRLSADYSSKLDNGSKISLGIQPQYLSVAGDFVYDTLAVKTGRFYPYTDLQNGVDVRRGIYAAYADYAGASGKLNYQAGLRLEYTDQSVELHSANYFSLFDGAKRSSYSDRRLDFFPNLHLEWAPGTKDRIILASSRRISRPPAKNMAPFLYRRHLEVYEVGDPQLKPEYLVNAEMSWARKIGRHELTLTGFYRGVNNAVFRVNTVTNQNPAVLAVTREEVLIRSYTNAGNSSSTGAELNANIDGGKFAKFFVGGSLFRYAVKGDIFGYQVDNSSTNWSLKANANFVLGKELKLSADYSLKSATVTAQGKNDLFAATNAALTYTPAKLKGWDVTLRYLDLFNTNNEGLDTQAFNKSGQEIFYQETTYFRKGSIVELGLTWSFNRKGKGNTRSESTFGKDQF